jgi:serine/threonine protein phosphatase PrpC
MKYAQIRIGRQDRCRVIPHGDRLFVGLADGAGNSGRGGVAAESVMRRLEDLATLDPVELLARCDQALLLSGGQTTAVIAVAGPDGIRGASVGDSGAWLVESGVELTASQARKPLLGSGEAAPVAFAGAGGTLLVASDGLFKYASWEEIRRIASQPELERIPEELVAAVRLPSGGFHDDVAIIVSRGPAPERAP